MLHVIQFALNNAVYASTGFNPCYMNILARPRVMLTPPLRGSGIGGRDSAETLADISPTTM